MDRSITFFGNERLATGLEATEAVTLRRLINADYKVSAVVTPYTPGRSRNPRPLEIETTAQQHAIPVLKPTTTAELIQMTTATEAAVGVLVAFGMIVPPEVMAAFKYGIINIHPSLLPHYRGSTPIEQAILDGVSKTGVSIMQLDRKLDAGPVLDQAVLKLSGKDSKVAIATQLQELGAQLLVEQLPRVIAGTARAGAQDEQAATFCSALAKSDGQIDWSKPAVQLEREIRAYLGWPGSRAKLWDKEVTITQAVVANSHELAASPGAEHLQLRQPGSILEEWAGRILVVTGDGALELLRLKPAGKREMTAAEFRRGRQ